mgnify:CR=1 FL=1
MRDAFYVVRKAEAEESEKVEEVEEIQHSSQRGVEVTTIPISIAGEYESIRDYIVFLEEKDYMAVNSYTITATETNNADVEISIYSVII